VGKTRPFHDHDSTAKVVSHSPRLDRRRNAQALSKSARAIPSVRSIANCQAKPISPERPLSILSYRGPTKEIEPLPH
jgi:hypothetical protein